jgi:hypothetical protein
MQYYGAPPPWVYPPQNPYPPQPPTDPLAGVNAAIAFYKGMKRDLQDENKDKGKDEKKKTSNWGFVETFVIISLAYPLVTMVQLAIFRILFH